MKIRTLFPLLALLVPVLKAETLVVLSGNSIQEKIDAASDGDIIAIFGGTYNQNITVNKKVRLVELAGQDVYITGFVTFTDLEEMPPFQGFRVANIDIKGTKGLVVKDVDCDGTLNLVNGVPDVSVIGGSQASILQQAGSLVTNSTTTTGAFTVRNDADKTIAFRTTVKGECSWGLDSGKAWFGYGKAKRIRCSGSSSNFVIVGATIDAEGSEDAPLDFRGNDNNLIVCNSKLINVKASSGHGVSDQREKVIHVSGSNHTGAIRNNYLQLVVTTGFSPRPIDFNNTSNCKIAFENNFFKKVEEGVSPRGLIFFTGPFGLSVENNYIETSRLDIAIVQGGSTQIDNLVGNIGESLIVDGNPYMLEDNSPLIDAGLIDPRYNDLDGSRNDIGPSGGSWYDPEGWTTENPVVISFDLSPDQVLGGVNDEVEISEIQAISAP